MLNPALSLGGLARVEEVPLTLEEVARVASLKVTSLKEQVIEVAEAETAILVKGDQGRPCILKPDLEGSWKKLCAVFWKPGGIVFLGGQSIVFLKLDAHFVLSEMCFSPQTKRHCLNKIVGFR